MALSSKDIVAKVRLALDQGSTVKVEREIAQALKQGTNPDVAKQNLGAVEGGMGKIGDMAKAVGAAVATYLSFRELKEFLQSAMKDYGDFNAAMTQSLAIQKNVTAGLQKRMEETAQKIGVDLNLGADKAAQAYYFLASAGLDAERAVATMPAVAMFAKAGMFDMARATEMAMDATSALGLKSKDAAENLKAVTRVTDVLVRANTLANATTEQFAEALTNKAGAALKNTHKDLEEGVAVLAAYADQGRKGAEGGELFSIFLRDIQRAAAGHKEMFKQYGIEVFDSAGKLRNLADIVQDLTGALGKLSDEQQINAVQQLGFNFRSIDAIKALLGTSDSIREYEKALRSAGGYTKQVAEQQMTAFNEKMGETWQRVKEAKEEVGQGLAEAALAAGDAIGGEGKGLVGVLQSLAQWIRENKEEVKTVATTLADLAVALAKLLEWSGEVITFTIAIIFSPADAIQKVKDWWHLRKYTTDDPENIGLDYMGSGGRESDAATQKAIDELAAGRGKRMDKVAYGDPPPGQKPPAKKYPKVNPDAKADEEEQKKAERKAENQRRLGDRLNAELAKLTADQLDDVKAKVAAMEAEYVKLYGKKIPDAAKAGLAKLRAAAAAEEEFRKSKLAGEDIDTKAQQVAASLAMIARMTGGGVGPSVEQVKMSMLEAYLERLKKEADQLDENSATRAKYNDVIRDTEKALADASEKVSDETQKNQDKINEEASRQWQDHLQQWGQAAVEMAGQAQSAWQQFFGVLISESGNAGKAFKILGNQAAAALVGGLGKYAASKAAENAVQAAEMLAYAIKDATTPGMQWAVGGDLAAAAKFAAVSVAWSALAGGAAAKASQLGSVGGGAPSAPSDTGGKTVDNAQRSGPDIHIYVDGMDPQNARHQELAGKAVLKYQERYGSK